MEAEELIELVSSAGSPNTWKISRRDLGFISGLVIVRELRLETSSNGTRAWSVESLMAGLLLLGR